MGSFKSPNESLEFLKNRFSEYYKSKDIVLPDRFGRREFAFVFFGGKGMMRHIGFDKKYSFDYFIKNKAPCHTYYSSAYYKTPGAPTMQEKDWMSSSK